MGCSTRNLLLIWALLLLQLQTRLCLNLSGILGQYQTNYQDRIDISSFQGQLINIQFQIADKNIQNSPTLIIVSETPIETHINITDILANKIYKGYYYDADALIQYRKQYINMPHRPGIEKIYYKIFNFDSYRRIFTRRYQIPYQITVNSSNLLQCSPCMNGGTLRQKNCLCENCKQGFSGKICSRKIQEPKNKQIQTNLKAFSQKFYHLNFEQKLIKVTIDKGLTQIFIQYSDKKNDVASFFNVLKDSQRYYRFEIVPSSQGFYIKIPQHNENLLLTISNLSDELIFAQIHQTNPDNIFTITLSIGISIFILIIIIGIFLLMYKRNQNTRVFVTDTKNCNLLSQKDMDFYFPICSLSSICKTVSVSQESNTNIQIFEQLQCSVCLQILTGQDKINICYCRHIFHVVCLRQWFKKSSLCPYCRCQHSIQEIISVYKDIIEKTKKSNLNGTELVRQIYSKREQPKTKEQFYFGETVQTLPKRNK